MSVMAPIAGSDALRELPQDDRPASTPLVGGSGDRHGFVEAAQ
jgi:hypothetical protein